MDKLKENVLTTAHPSTESCPPRHIPIKTRWLLFALTMVLGFGIIRYPVSIQNFQRADGLLALGQTGPAIEHYRRAIILDPDFDQAYSMMAWAYELRNDLGSARKTYEEGLRHVHDDELYYMHFVVFLWKTRDFKRALAVSAEGLRLYPESRNMLRIYGNSLEKNNRPEDAQRLWHRYLEKYPDDRAVRNKIRK
jgi:tetratricopeptide (TPR) repeat protein